MFFTLFIVRTPLWGCTAGAVRFRLHGALTAPSSFSPSLRSGVAGLSAPPASVFVAVGNRRPRWARAYVVTTRTQVPNAKSEFAFAGELLPCIDSGDKKAWLA